MRHFYVKQACIPAAEVLTSRPGLKANNSARVAELVDALDSGSSGGNPVKVRVLSRAPFHYQWRRGWDCLCRASAKPIGLACLTRCNWSLALPLLSNPVLRFATEGVLAPPPLRENSPWYKDLALSKKNGGGGGIRTHGTFRLSGFQDRRNRPLYHPSGTDVSRRRFDAGQMIFQGETK